jgi:hypothetical protein
MSKTDNLLHKLTRARTELLLNQPFFGTLCLRLKLVSGPVPTMATEGRRILYDQVLVNSLQPAELEAVLAHDVLKRYSFLRKILLRVVAEQLTALE